jgi:hypothetical protein
VFLNEYVIGDVEKTDLNKLTQEEIISIEADCYWCLTKLLDGIQDNYTHGQPGLFNF